MQFSKCFLLSGLLFITISLVAQFGAPITIADNFSNDWYTLADFDGDGDTDVYYLQATQYFWLENQGNAQFAAPVALNLTGNINWGKLADEDGDGDLDWIHYQFSTNGVDFYISRQDEVGNFGEPVLLASSVDNFSVYEIHDFNGDGHADILRHESLNSMSIVFNSGDLAVTNWEEEYYLPTAWDANLFDVDDYDHDGFPDVTIIFSQQASPTAGLYFHRNNGDGTFSPMGEMLRNIGQSFHHTRFDFDQDGVDDMLYPNSNLWQWFTMEDELIFHLNDLPNSTNFAASDIDQDGREDLVWRNGGSIFWTRFLGDRTFADTQYPITNQAGTAPRGSSPLADLNGDGLEDFVIKLTNNSLVWFPNQASQGAVLLQCYYDENENGIQDDEEPGVQGIPVDFDGGNMTYFTDAQGQINYFAFLVEEVDLTLGTSGCWVPVDGVSDYNLSVVPGEVATLNIGFRLTGDESATSATSFTEHSTTRCFWPVAFSLMHHNSSCQIESGVVALRLDPNTTLVDTAIPPDFVDGDVLWWSFEDLIPGDYLQWGLTLLMPNEQLTGASLHFDWYFFSNDCEGVVGENVPSAPLSEGLSLCDTDAYNPVVRCSYDPNDKQVQPLRDATRNYTLFEEELTYTIRFQNTGNDTAFNVHIRDYLDPALDWSSLQTLGASHDYELSLDWETGEIDYFFKDILLPDSIVNEPGSHGFVQYRIRSQEGLPENTLITNEARIYFDFNPPIITNTVHSELVSVLPEFRSPEALFTLGRNEQNIWLQDQSLFDPDSWQWDFGDGNTSSDRNPRHSYAGAGIYNICLTVENEQGTDQLCRLVTISTVSPGNISFTDGTVVYTSSSLNFLVDATDLNGDGLSDAVVASAGDSLLVLLNDGNDALAAPQLLAIMTEVVRDMELADLDQDGDQDIVLALANGSVQWLTNLGDNSWSVPTMISEQVSSVLETIEVADLNRDGRPDIVVGWRDYLAWVENTGSGTFTTPHLISDELGRISELKVADFDQDNDQDLVLRVGSGSNQVILRLDQRNGTFTLQEYVRMATWFSTNRFKVTDYDLDTYADVFYGWEIDANPVYLPRLTAINNEEGNFTGVSGLGGFQYSQGNEFNTFDLDQDGDQDILITDYLQLKYRRNRAGAFPDNYNNLASISYSSSPRRIVPFMLDHDEDTDLLLKNNQQLLIFENLTALQRPLANFRQVTSAGLYQFTDLSHYGPTEWLWTFGDGSTSTEQSPAHTYAETGEYEVCLTVYNAVGEDTFCSTHYVGNPPVPCTAPSALTVTDITEMTASISWNYTGQQPDYWEIEVVTAGEQPLGEPTFTNITDPFFSWENATPNTQYEAYVRGVCADDFSDWIGPVMFLTVGTDKLPETVQSLTLSPNPTTGIIQLDARLTQLTEVHLEITDLLGRTLWQSTTSRTQHLLEQLDLTAYPHGTYLLRVQVGQEGVIRRLVKL